MAAQPIFPSLGLSQFFSSLSPFHFKGIFAFGRDPFSRKWGGRFPPPAESLTTTPVCEPCSLRRRSPLFCFFPFIRSVLFFFPLTEVPFDALTLPFFPTLLLWSSPSLCPRCISNFAGVSLLFAVGRFFPLVASLSCPPRPDYLRRSSSSLVILPLHCGLCFPYMLCPILLRHVPFIPNHTLLHALPPPNQFPPQPPFRLLLHHPFSRV